MSGTQGEEQTKQRTGGEEPEQDRQPAREVDQGNQDKQGGGGQPTQRLQLPGGQATRRRATTPAFELGGEPAEEETKGKNSDGDADQKKGADQKWGGRGNEAAKGGENRNHKRRRKQARVKPTSQLSNPPLRGKAVPTTGWLPLVGHLSDPSLARLPCCSQE